MREAYDFSVTNSTLPTHRALAASHPPGHTINKLARTKISKYKDACAVLGYKFIPLIFNSISLGWQDAADSLVRKFMKDIHQHRGDSLRHGTRYWITRLSFNIARAQSNAINSSLRRLAMGDQQDNHNARYYEMLPSLIHHN